MAGPCRPFRKAPGSQHETDAFHGSGFQVFYAGAEPIVEYIGLSRGSSIRALYRGVDLFELPAHEVVTRISFYAPFDPNDDELGYSYIFPVLDLSLWRPTLPESPGDEDGRQFSTIGVGTRGYFNEPLT